METNEKMMTGEESLRIITDMINTTKVNFSQSSFHLILWGWLILVCSIAEFLLGRFSGFASPWYVWFLTIPGVFVSVIYGFSKGRQSKVRTYGDMLNMWTWIGFLIAAIILFILMQKRMESFSPFILMLAGFPTFLSGFITRFRPLIAGGVSMWLLTLVAAFGGPDIAPFAIPAAMITGYLIPGYLIRRKSSHDTV
jgi:hypothetical protein